MKNRLFLAKVKNSDDRKYSNSGLKLNCWQEVGDNILYSQFIDSYFGDETL